VFVGAAIATCSAAASAGHLSLKLILITYLFYVLTYVLMCLLIIFICTPLLDSAPVLSS
jgi:hypothetical protein